MLVKVFGTGWAGVDLFFVLSGFLITGILLDTKTKRHFFRNFYARRTLRVFPLYYVVLFIIFVILTRLLPVDTPDSQFVIRNQIWLWTYTTNLGFIVLRKAMFDADWFQLNHFWSLAVEEQFYLCWPLLVFVLSPGKLMRLSWAIVVLALSLRLGLFLAHQRPGALYFPTPCRADSLAMGGLIAICLRGPDGLSRLSHIARRAGIPIVLALAGIVIWRHALIYNDWTMLTFGYSLIAGLAACLIIYCISPAASNPIRRAFEVRWLRTLGKYSYGMYVLHMFVRYVLDDHIPLPYLVKVIRLESAAVIAHAALLLALTFASAFISWHLWEKHFLKLKRHFAYGS